MNRRTLIGRALGLLLAPAALFRPVKGATPPPGDELKRLLLSPELYDQVVGIRQLYAACAPVFDARRGTKTSLAGYSPADMLQFRRRGVLCRVFLFVEEPEHPHPSLVSVALYRADVEAADDVVGRMLSILEQAVGAPSLAARAVKA